MVMLAGVLQLAGCGAGGDSIETEDGKGNTYATASLFCDVNFWEPPSWETEEGTITGDITKRTGLALDITSADYAQLDDAQADTAEAKWFAENCWKYGFILRYPPEKSDVTGIIYEPWHYRYVGKEAAKEITESGLTLEEYLEQSGVK